MDSIMNFLLDNYIWVLIIGLVIIIILIGFIVDSKNKQKKLLKLNEGGADNSNKQPVVEQSTAVNNGNIDNNIEKINKTVPQNNINGVPQQNNMNTVLEPTGTVINDFNIIPDSTLPPQQTIALNNGTNVNQQGNIQQPIINDMPNNINNNIVKENSVLPQNNIDVTPEPVNYQPVVESTPVSNNVVEEVKSETVSNIPNIPQFQNPTNEITSNDINIQNNQVQQPTSVNTIPNNIEQIIVDPVVQTESNISPTETANNTQEEIIVEEITPNSSPSTSWQPQVGDNNNNNIM